MTEQNEGDPPLFDAEWEIRKLSTRIMDIMDIIDELKSKDKSINARISRMRLARIEEDEGESPETAERETVRHEVEDMTLEERAVLFAKLLDRE